MWNKYQDMLVHSRKQRACKEMRNKACRKAVLGMQQENPWLMEPVVGNINLTAVYSSWLLLSDKTHSEHSWWAETAERSRIYIWNIGVLYILFYHMFSLHFNFKRLVWFFADIVPVKGAAQRALEIEDFCFLINKHGKHSRKSAFLILLSTHLPPN